ALRARARVLRTHPGRLRVGRGHGDRRVSRARGIAPRDAPQEAQEREEIPQARLTLRVGGQSSSSWASHASLRALALASAASASPRLSYGPIRFSQPLTLPCTASPVARS